MQRARGSEFTLSGHGSGVWHSKIAYNTFKDKGTLDMILNGEQVDFPIEIISSDDDSKLSMILQSIKFTPSGGFATMYMRYEVGEGDKRQYLYFAGTDIGFSKSAGFMESYRDVDVSVTFLQIPNAITSIKQTIYILHTLANNKN